MSEPTELPEAITRYQSAHDRHDTATALATFTADARVVDEDREYVGASEIRHWLETAAHEFTYTRTYLGATLVARDAWVVHNRLEGDFPGNVADLDYRFTVSDGRISELVIAP